MANLVGHLMLLHFNLHNSRRQVIIFVLEMGSEAE